MASVAADAAGCQWVVDLAAGRWAEKGGLFHYWFVVSPRDLVKRGASSTVGGISWQCGTAGEKSVPAPWNVSAPSLCVSWCSRRKVSSSNGRETGSLATVLAQHCFVGLSSRALETTFLPGYLPKAKIIARDVDQIWAPSAKMQRHRLQPRDLKKREAIRQLTSEPDKKVSGYHDGYTLPRARMGPPKRFTEWARSGAD